MDVNLDRIAKQLISDPSFEIDAAMLLVALRAILKLDSDQAESIDAFSQACITHYLDSIDQNPNHHENYYNLANIYTELNRDAEALSYYHKALELNPNYAQVYFSLGNLDLEQGKDPEAIANFKTAIALDPSFAKPYVNLAYLLEKQEDLEASLVNLQKAVEIEPEYWEAHRNLGRLLTRLDRLDRAVESYQKATLHLVIRQIQAKYSSNSLKHSLFNYVPSVPSKPQSGDRSSHQKLAKEYFRIGNLDLEQEKYSEASANFQTAIELDPNFAKPYVNMAYILEKQGDLEASAINLQKAIQIQPDFWEAHRNLGIALLKLERYDEALESCQTAVRLQPDDPNLRIILGDALVNQGDVEAAIESYQLGLTHHRQSASAYRLQHLILPILYNTEAEIDLWRSRFSKGLQTLDDRITLTTEIDRQWALDLIGADTIFFLAYQGKNDLELQKQYGKLVERVMAANYPQWSQEGSQHRWESRNQPQRVKIRIGYLSGFFFGYSSVSRAILGWLEHLDRSQFEIYCYHTGRKVDAFTAKIQAITDKFHHINHGFDAIFTQLAADNLDILIFADIGMHSQTTQIAALRFAPVQCTCWGHPITSGLPTIDYYLSGDLMEPEDHQLAQANYTEELIRLPKIGVSFPKPSLPKVVKTRADFNLPEQSVVYLCCQLLFKYLPQHDYIFAAIAKQVPQARFIFVDRPRRNYVAAQFRSRLQTAFAKFDLDYQRYCIVMPTLPMDDYLSLSLVADVFLDTIGFSGGCTSFDSIACNLPIVTLPSEFMRGRHSYGILQVLGVTDTIAQTEADYIEIAVRLGLDPEWRKDIKQKMRLREDDLFDDLTCVRALEDFFKEKVNAGFS